MPKCKLCGRDYVMITHSHLKLYHNITLEEYKDKFPWALIRDEDYCDEALRRERLSESWWFKPEEEREEICKRLSEVHTGIYPNEETRRKMSEASKKTWEDPKHRELVIPLISKPRNTKTFQSPEYRKLRSELTKKQWNDPEMRKRLLDGQHRMPSLDEGYLTYLLNEDFPSQWEYTGSKSFIGGGRRSPDWTHTSLKKVIEYDEYYWHICRRYDNPEDKIRYYANLGYDCLIVTNVDLWLERASLLQRIKEFSEQGVPDGNTISK